MKTSKDRLGVKIAASGNSPLPNYTVRMPTGAICQTGCRAPSRIRRNGVGATGAWSDLLTRASRDPKTTAARLALSPDVMTLHARVCCGRSLSESVGLDQVAATSSPSMKMIGCPLSASTQVSMLRSWTGVAYPQPYDFAPYSVGSDRRCSPYLRAQSRRAKSRELSPGGQSCACFES